jgi:hypothetical protein
LPNPEALQTIQNIEHIASKLPFATTQTVVIRQKRPAALTDRNSLVAAKMGLPGDLSSGGGPKAHYVR